MAGCMLFVCETLRQWLLYKSHCHLCQKLFDLNEGDIEQLPTYLDDPLEIFEETRIELNIYRWVVYMLWLKQSRKPFYWFQQILKKYPIPSIITLKELVWLHERKAPELESLQPKLSLNAIEIPLNPVV